MTTKDSADSTLQPGDLFCYPDSPKLYEYVGDEKGESGEPQRVVREYEEPISGPPGWLTMLAFAIGTVALGWTILSW